ncbi:glycerol-3-phosphate 1-O-acyltransferase PlsY [Cytobacillus sp. FSL W7-1323]|uniref:Glycerol-3-phosphate acyltransferase n=1 Tax=Cytobacillus kochii TaxID=859143 RepID=A0A248TFX1_9BACI|nr:MULTISPECIES: glycerol-3-phosphate 1-O-acyltransferase PlsY [Cytobacillus]ASV67083.1 acyl-phosphate glycerol 3-phosphate acyltransferase [Cytobacillus kochii]MCA1028965.1 glycerol-3-phosphate 1-O-acyltransferase PlsY [Cytobacillus kochii]MCM3324392.1 glycerol-3-phosphate 1-O-acyltransferase PlsY [Cytobacillus kochii]MCM3346786.1 glycerol-3-phosphate 1-O-acyltransferase PlsY [Cytobacillus kochii]MDM5206061.1 glycerol-3-phosphate 1-O-acyltransferase PlsY [Cytobacillus kochii]
MDLFILLLSYLIGSIPTALLVGKLFFGIDIREYGSNNPGATNTLRVLGKRAGVTVLIIDIGKGALAASLPLLLQTGGDPLIIGLFAVVGHCFPIFAGFRGGKAIATTAGVLLVANIWLFLIAYITFVAVVSITKYLYYGSISVGVALFLYATLSPLQKNEWIFFLFLLLLIYLHRSNIRNHLLQREPKINDKKIKDDRLPPKQA